MDKPGPYMHGTPIGDANTRYFARKASIADLVLLMKTELSECAKVLPPYADKDNREDPSHASACAVRAYAIMCQLEGRISELENRRLSDKEMDQGLRIVEALRLLAYQLGEQNKSEEALRLRAVADMINDGSLFRKTNLTK